MKKMLIVLLSLMLLVTSAFAESETAELAFTPTDSNILVACFSATGNTWPLAEYAAEYLNADLFRIEPKEPYTDADLNYNDDRCRANVEMQDDTCRPALAATVENMAQYDTVILAFPIWWEQAPRIIETFLESYDFTGKTVIPFATSGGSDMGKTADILRAVCPAADILPGKRLSARESAEAVRAWLETLGK